MIQQNTEEHIEAPELTQPELQAMHRWCLKYRVLVCGGETPTSEQDAEFLLFSRVCYAEGVANAR